MIYSKRLLYLIFCVLAASVSAYVFCSEEPSKCSMESLESQIVELANKVGKLSKDQVKPSDEKSFGSHAYQNVLLTFIALYAGYKIGREIYDWYTREPSIRVPYPPAKAACRSTHRLYLLLTALFHRGSG